MAGKISLLSEQVINQIAAGEVLEHPASAVKELVENAIDAGATRIGIEIVGGGLQLIRIEDNGSGMGRGDAIACLQRHATSKIRNTEDLFKLGTLGFRGEALASIASVSHFELQTFDEIESTRIVARGGTVVSVEPCARNRGTTIDIRSLFYNVPARLKFQKSPSGCQSQILKTIQTMALGYEKVSFSLRAEEKVLFEQSGHSDWKFRAKEILGHLSHFVEHAIGDYKVIGLVGSPEEARGNRSCQYTYVNKRPVFSPLISRAVKDGYSTRIAESHFPSFLLYLELPPDQFDVNVHPQKKEIRFQNDSKVYQLIERALSLGFKEAVNHSFSSPLSFTRPEEIDLPSPFPWVMREEVQQELIPPSWDKRPLAVVGPFLLLEGEGFFLLDLKGAEARILFEEREKKGDPVEIELEGEEGEKWAAELQEIGIEARFLGGRFLTVDAWPLGIETSEIPELLSRFKADRRAAATFCRFCRSRRKRYNLDEASMIEKRLSQCSDSQYDPLGRLIYRKIKEEDLANLLEEKR